jgi:hypothetical protein
LSKMLLEEVKAAEAEKLEKDKGKEEGEGDIEKEKGKDIPVKEKPVENRDWKRNGNFRDIVFWTSLTFSFQMNAGWNG